jgi:hypothetical protein
LINVFNCMFVQMHYICFDKRRRGGDAYTKNREG